MMTSILRAVTGKATLRSPHQRGEVEIDLLLFHLSTAIRTMMEVRKKNEETSEKNIPTDK